MTKADELPTNILKFIVNNIIYESEYYDLRQWMMWLYEIWAQVGAWLIYELKIQFNKYLTKQAYGLAVKFV